MIQVYIYMYYVVVNKMKELELVWSLTIHHIHAKCCLQKRGLTSFHKVTKEANTGEQ